MIAEGRRLANGPGSDNRQWICARAEDVRADLGRFHVVTMGQSFHWMRRDLVLKALSPIVNEGGGLALFNPGKRRPQESWETVASQIVTQYLGRRPRHPTASPEAGHEPSLRRSACFSIFTAREFPSTLTRNIPSILGYLYSTTGAAKPLFGDRILAFEANLSRTLLRANPTGKFDERLETEVLVAPTSLFRQPFTVDPWMPSGMTCFFIRPSVGALLGLQNRGGLSAKRSDVSQNPMIFEAKSLVQNS